ncbi:hypothetical protein B0H19DRAFT_1156583 [Mycena capillaripes]|nr:hypothetical protein B0H19DRAFT_1156583 [Mycena capillaripes]
MLMLNICNTWSYMALATPALWAAIFIPLPCSECFQEGLKLCLQRAGNHPLSISLRGNLDDRCVSAILQRYGPRLKDLELYDDKGLEY